MLDEIKAVWTDAISNWVRVEELLGFATPRDGLTPSGRSAAISLWVQNARRRSIVIQPGAYEDFVGEWFAWWSSVNPDWRQRTSGRLVAGGTGEWGAMFKPGKYGFLLVLECLVGLRVAAPVEDLILSVRDVHWVLECVVEALRAE